MIVEVLDNKDRKVGRINIHEFENECKISKVIGDISVNDSEFNDYDTDSDWDRKLQITLETSPFESQNHASCVSPIEQELSAYKALKKSFLEGNYNNCSVLINYYFGHIDYWKEFGYNKTHGEICLILYTNLLFSLESGKDSFVNFIDSMIGKIEWNLKH